MKFNITRDDAEFYVDKEKGVVVCVIDNTRDLFKQFALDNYRISYMCDEEYNFIHYINKGDSTLSKKMDMPSRFTGIARLGEGDKWDEEVGCAIAFSRAKDALLQSFWKRVDTYFDTIYTWIEDAANMTDKLGEKFSINTEKRHNYIKELIGPDPEEE